MEYVSNPSQIQKFMSNNESKLRVALNCLLSRFFIFLQTLMSNAGFNGEESDPRHPTFTRMMLFALIEIAKKLHNFKSCTSESLSDIETRYIEKIWNEKEFSEQDEKMSYAIQLFDINFPQSLKNILMNIGYKKEECAENHICFLCFYSMTFVAVAEVYFRHHSLKNSLFEVYKCDENTGLTVEKRQDSKELSYSSCVRLISTSKNFLLYHVTTPSHESALKVLKTQNRESRAFRRLENERNITKSIIHPALRLSIEKTKYQDREAVFLEWAHGCTLSNLIGLRLSDFFSLSREIVSALLAMHEKHIMHLNLSCEHIIYDERMKATKIIGCGSSSSFRRNMDYISRLELSEKDLRCIAPEQTGKTKKEVDFRADFYSLGVIFHRLLTGKYPFEGDNPTTLINMHIMQEPTPVHNINPEIPKTVSDVITKLMKKEAQDRYNSAKGLMYDLDLILTEYNSNNELHAVSLAEHDKSDVLLIPQKLYGRDSEYGVLRLLLEKVFAGSFQMALVQGSSGTGKSKLVNELYGEVVKKHGFLLTGKFDKAKKEPYSAIVEAITGFCDHLLIENDTTLSRFESVIKAAVGEEGKILTDLVNNLHLIIGAQDAVDISFGKEAKDRFNYLLQKVLKALCSEHPIVLVLEDLQWCDFDSLNFLSTFLQDKSHKNLYLIGTYCENIADSESLLPTLISIIEKHCVAFVRIKLDYPEFETINNFIADALCIAPVETYSLSSLIYSRTNGNIMHVKQVLISLFDQGSLYFSKDSMRWRWDSCKDDKPENLLILLRRKIMTFDVGTQKSLKVASILGSPFSLPALKTILNCSKSVEGVISSGLIVQNNASETMYRFVHDKVQEACYSLLPKNPQSIFQYIANKLRNVLSGQDLEDNLFVIANLLYSSVDLIQDKKKRIDTAKFLMRVGEKALAATAYKQATKFFMTGIDLLEEKGWNDNYQLTLDFHYLAVKAAYSNSQEEQMNTLLEKVFEKAKCSLDLVPSALLKMRYSNDLRQYDRAQQAGISILLNLDEKISFYQQNEVLLAVEIKKAKNLFSAASNVDLFKLKEMEDKKALAIMEIYSQLLHSCFGVNNMRLSFFIRARMVQLTFEFGTSKYSSVAFSTFGTLLRMKNDASSYEFGKIGLEFLRRYNTKELVPHVYLIFYIQISPFFESIHNVFNHLLKAYRIGYEVGRKEESMKLGCTFCLFSFLTGRSLNELMDEVEEFDNIYLAHGQRRNLNFLALYQALQNITRNNDKNVAFLQGSYFDFTSLLKCQNKREIVRPYLICAVVAFIFYEYTSAFQYLQQCRLHVEFISRTYIYSHFLFYEAMVSLELARDELEKSCLIQNAEDNISKLKKLSVNAPENFLNKVMILEAELCRSRGSISEAEQHYKEAIKLSQIHRFIHEQALVCERLGQMYLPTDVNAGSKFIFKAYECFKSWGATEKITHLFATYPSIFAHKTLSSGTSSSSLPIFLQIENKSLASISQVTYVDVSSSASEDRSKRLRLS